MRLFYYGLRVNKYYSQYSGLYVNEGNHILPARTLSETVTSKESKWSGKNAWKLWLRGVSLSALSGLGFVIYMWGPPVKDENGKEIRDKYTDMSFPKSYLWRAVASLVDFEQSIKDPVSEKLLPDPVKPPYHQPPYTLVIEIKDILVHPDWKNSAPVVQQLDAKGEYIHYRLFRDATRYQNGVHLKDLSCLNRDMSKIILIDCESDAAKLQPDNSLIIRKWKGEDADRELVDLAAFLRMIAMGGVDDVRPVLQHYKSFDDPLEEFRHRHENLMAMEAEKKKESIEKASKRPSSRFNFSF